MVVAQNFLMPWSDEHFIQFRAKAYNGFNHSNFADPTANINSSTFGHITKQANDNRVLQFALRYQFWPSKPQRGPPLTVRRRRGSASLATK